METLGRAMVSRRSGSSSWALVQASRSVGMSGTSAGSSTSG